MADSRIFFNSQPLLPIGNQVSTGSSQLSSRVAGIPRGKDSFASILAGEAGRVTFSRHAISRLESRNIDFSEQDLARLDEVVGKMDAKGARESLVYLNDVALIVSVPNKTVITAMDGNAARENIFTNIDSAAII